MENKEIQKAIKEWNKEKFEELIREITKDYNKDPLWVLVLNATISIIVREFRKKFMKKASE
jgi:hypothetical protein